MNTRLHTILVEEAWRSVVWFGASLFSWAIIITEAPSIQATAGTVLGLPLLTAFAAATLLVGIRLRTGHDIRLSADGAYLAWVSATLTGALASLYYILALGGTTLVIPAVIVSAVVGRCSFSMNFQSLLKYPLVSKFVIYSP
jgi:hypothetical protein